MRIALPKLTSTDFSFPQVDNALPEPDGLLAFGGDLSPRRLQLAYQSGIFPWFSRNEPIMWWSPSVRTILAPSDFHLSHSMMKFMRKMPFQVSVNQAFSQVIRYCSHIPRGGQGTWITREMIDAYEQLHQLGCAHSIEVWDDNQLVGGLYGVSFGSVFCGESMFHSRTNASKVAFYFLCAMMQSLPDSFIDCQMQTAHLNSLGAIQITRSEFIQKLKTGIAHPIEKDFWQPRCINML